MNVDFIQQMPGLLIAKSSDLTFLGVSPELSRLGGWKNPDMAVGLTDYDIPCGAVESADKFRKLDELALSKGKMLETLDVQPYTDGWKVLLATRYPMEVRKSDDPALMSYGNDITHITLLKNYLMLYLHDTKMGNSIKKSACYLLDNDFLTLELTDKQQECLFYTLRGKTAKDIALLLHRSVRTIEDYIDQLKDKFSVKTKSQLIEKAIFLNYLFFIPRSLLKGQLI